MFLVVVGMLLVIAGIAMAAFRTAERGRLSQPTAERPFAHPKTLEPSGKGKRLSFKANLPAFGIAALGAVLILAGSLDLR